MKNENKFNPSEFESKWQSLWEKHRVYQPDLKAARKPFYNLMMFPYPSAEGLHVGNMYAFTGADIYGRFQRMQGNNVFEPIGLDGFGIHSENYAIKVGKHPAEQAKISQENFYRQLHAIGNGFAWENRLETYDPDYYRWTQWIFVQMFKKGLAYRKKSLVNFCPSCKTVLSDEQVIDGRCERCKSEVEKREMEQWFFKITDYAERLLQNTYRKDFQWTEKVKIGQRNWIGKSEGVEIEFRIKNHESRVKIFTTAIDTIYGATFMVISPDHPIIDRLDFPKEYAEKVNKYINDHKKKAKVTNHSLEKEKTGIFSGIYAVNPFSRKEIPVWIADYVLMDYGTGAIMGVPGHDARDYEFAKKFGIEIINVVKPKEEIKEQANVAEDGFWDYPEIKTKFSEHSILFNSDFLNGLTNKQAKKLLEQKSVEMKIGKKVTTYKLRDWCISRQRYWGAPIPMINCEKCGWNPVPEDQLPVLLPPLNDWKPEGTGKGPLAKIKSFVETKCPICGGKAERETDVCDTFLDSSWYHLRYPSIDDKINPWHPEITRKWLPVTQYIGGAEHTVLHLLYARFVAMVFKDMEYLEFDEPYTRFFAHGLIIAEGAKMSKSRGNVIVPDVYINKYGADTLRSYLMFLGPFDQGGDFRDTGIQGMFRFLNRVWRLVNDVLSQESRIKNQESSLDRFMHKAIKEVTEDIASFRYNTAIAHIMEYVNEIQNAKSKNQNLNKENIETLLLLLAPFAPHMTEELWSQFTKASAGKQSIDASDKFSSIHLEKWPEYNQNLLIEDNVTVIVQVNGKLRETIKIQTPKSKVQNEVEKRALNTERIKPYVEGKKIKKTIFVPGKLINFVI